MSAPWLHTPEGFRWPACPDCGAEPTSGNELRHLDTCPVGRDSDAQLDDDRVWFDAHPDAPHRWRPPTFHEQVELRALFGLGDVPGTFAGRVLVRRTALDGVRTKTFDTVVFVPDVPGVTR